MVLIVDSGSTKTDWMFADSANSYTAVKTSGINPAVQPQEDTDRCLSHELQPEMDERHICTDDITAIHFYGAGCTPEKAGVMTDLLKAHFPKATTVEVASDLLAAARALCGRSEGIVCILGTGANSCIYDGRNIVAHTPALGFILGDEGSGAVLGKTFINGILKGWLSEELRKRFLAERSLTMADIIDKVYRQPMPNRFLASSAEFIARNMEEFPALQTIVEDNFDNFFAKNILPYRTTMMNGHTADISRMNVNAVGSIAFHYRPLLEKAAKKYNMHIGKVMKSPAQGLLCYHFIL